jgi:tetratricopeptide (TPR) repeat protein
LTILNLAELSGVADLMARSYAVMSLTAAVVRRRRLAALYDRTAMRVAQDARDPGTQAYVNWVTAVRAVGDAQWDVVTMRAGQAYEIARQTANLRLQVMSQQTLAWPAYVAGDFSRAVELAESQLRTARDSGNRLWEAWALNGRSETTLMLGDDQATIADCRRALEILSEEADRVEEIRAGGLLAVACLNEGRTEEALAIAERALLLVGRTDLTNFTLYEGLAGVCEVLATLAEQAQSQTGHVPRTLRGDLRAALSVFHRYARVFPMGRPRWHTLQARLATLEGAGVRGRRHLDRALGAADALGMAYEKGLALLGAARSPVLEVETRARRAEQASLILRGGRALRAARSLQEDLARASA